MDDDKAENMDTTSALLAMNLPGVEVWSLTQFTFWEKIGLHVADMF